MRIESIPNPRSVQVTRISPALNPSNRSLLFEAEVDNHDHNLRAGLFAEADVFVDPQAQALVVPRSSIIEFAGAEKVWKVVDGLVTEQTVITGTRREQGIEILSGLVAGDLILIDGSKGRVAKIDPASMIDHANSTDKIDSPAKPAETPTVEKEPSKETAPTPVASE
ncbi:MAG: efflux RND transporter periplasmic adaptor subunit [Planctomycetaceae bacterium]